MRLFFALLVAAAMFCAPATAYQLHVRDDDPGAMQEIAKGEVELDIDTILVLRELGAWTTSAPTAFGTVTWGGTLAGLVEGCMDAPNNTSTGLPGGIIFWRTTGLNGTLNRMVVDGKPSVPLTAQPRDDGGSVFVYRNLPGSTSLSHGGCPGEGPLGVGAGWGQSSWAMVFDKPRTAFYINFAFSSNTVGERLHLEFWDENGDKIGHQDIVNSADNPPQPISFAWISSRPVAAFSAWPQNAPGGGFLEIGLGDTTSPVPMPPPEPKMLDERVQDIEDCLNAQTEFGCPSFLGN